VGGCPILPVYAGEIQAKCLGMSIDVFDAARADPISISELGETGELVCTQPFPSQPLEFFGKEGPAKYRAAYFARFGSGVWCQGDFVQCLPDTKGILMMGRSYVPNPYLLVLI
jgi:acetoacetyl-CoA synthetase